MEKRSDAQIYILAYNKIDYGFWDNSLYTPLQCGAEETNLDICNIKDNTGDNISNENYFYSETTGTYWIWKNAPKTKYIGQCQYRRRIMLDENFDFDNIFKNVGAIASKPLNIGTTVEKQMKHVHPQINTKTLKDVVIDLYPLYEIYYKNVIENGNTLFYSTAYIMRYDDFCEYCDFLFNILKEYKKRCSFVNKDLLESYITPIYNKYPRLQIKPLNYHMLIGGFLQERLFTLFAIKNLSHKNIRCVNFIKFENIKL